MEAMETAEWSVVMEKTVRIVRSNEYLVVGVCWGQIRSIKNGCHDRGDSNDLLLFGQLMSRLSRRGGSVVHWSWYVLSG